MRRGVLRDLGLGLALLVVGCATRTTLSDVWTADTVPGAPLERVLVIGISDSDLGRRSFEDGFVASLARRGVEATPSYELIPDRQQVSRDVVRDAIRGRGFDGVLVTRLLEVDEESRYVPPQTYVTPSYYGRGLYGYMGHGWDVVHQPGYAITTTIVRLETHLYDARSAELVWAAHSDTFEPRSKSDAVESVTAVLAERLAADGMIPDA